MRILYTMAGLFFAQYAAASEFRLFGGGAIGPTYSLGRASSEVDKMGFHFMLTGAASWRTQEWDFDAGMAWMYNRLYSGKGESKEIAPSGEVLKQKDISIRSRTGLITSAARWGLPEFPIKFGPTLAYITETSVAFQYNPARPRARFLTGISATRDFDFIPGLAARALGDLTTDLNISHRQVFFLTLGFQIGIAPKFQEKIVEIPPPPLVVPAPAPSPIPALPPVRVILDGQNINFDTAKWELEPRLEKFVAQVGQWLLAHKDKWKSLAIEGHTDSRGKLAYNTELSRKRAQTIMDILVKQGLPATQISAIGYGPSQPIVTPEVKPEDFRKNRRVVMSFDGVTAPTELQEEIAKIKKSLGIADKP